jgi:hypothetical protein
MKDKTETNDLGTNGWNAPGLFVTCGLLMATILYLDLLIPLGAAIGVAYVSVILISLWSPQNSVTVLMAVVCSALTISAFFLQPEVVEMWKVIFNRVIALFAIWITAIQGLQRKIAEQRRERVRREREIAKEHTRILHGLLPICSSCKKIRNDEGYWVQIEEYIRAHSEADFSHGICQECAKKLYPEFYKG